MKTIATVMAWLVMAGAAVAASGGSTAPGGGLVPDGTTIISTSGTLSTGSGVILSSGTGDASFLTIAGLQIVTPSAMQAGNAAVSDIATNAEYAVYADYDQNGNSITSRYLANGPGIAEFYIYADPSNPGQASSATQAYQDGTGFLIGSGNWSGLGGTIDNANNANNANSANYADNANYANNADYAAAASDFATFFGAQGYSVNGSNLDFLVSNGAADNLTVGGNSFSSGDINLAVNSVFAATLTGDGTAIDLTSNTSTAPGMTVGNATVAASALTSGTLSAFTGVVCITLDGTASYYPHDIGGILTFTQTP
jgi:hypothetical protein